MGFVNWKRLGCWRVQGSTRFCGQRNPTIDPSGGYVAEAVREGRNVVGGYILNGMLTLGAPELVAGKIFGAGIIVLRGARVFKRITNPVPLRLARVIPANIKSKTLGAPDATDVFVTAADDIVGLNASQIANKLTIPNSSSGFKIIEFNVPRIGLSSPINRTNRGFIGFGRTAGGAREFSLPNQLIPKGSIINIIH